MNFLKFLKKNTTFVSPAVSDELHTCDRSLVLYSPPFQQTGICQAVSALHGKLFISSIHGRLKSKLINVTRQNSLSFQISLLVVYRTSKGKKILFKAVSYYLLRMGLVTLKWGGKSSALANEEPSKENGRGKGSRVSKRMNFHPFFQQVSKRVLTLFQACFKSP